MPFENHTDQELAELENKMGDALNNLNTVMERVDRIKLIKSILEVRISKLDRAKAELVPAIRQARAVLDELGRQYSKKKREYFQNR